MPSLDDLLSEFQEKKEKFRDQCLHNIKIQEYLLEKLREALNTGVAKYSEKYNSSIKGLNSSLKKEIKDALNNIGSRKSIESTLIELKLNHRLFFESELLALVPKDTPLYQEYLGLISIKSQILELSAPLIASTVRNKKNYSSILDTSDLLQEAYIIADESLLIYNNNFSEETTWTGYLSTRINQILSKKLSEFQPTLQMSRGKDKKILKHLSLSNNAVLSMLDAEKNSESNELINSNILTSVLNEKEYKYISLRYGLDGNFAHTLNQLSKKLNKSSLTLRTLEREILNKLKHELS